MVTKNSRYWGRGGGGGGASVVTSSSTENSTNSLELTELSSINKFR